MRLNIRLLSLMVLFGLVVFGCTGPGNKGQDKLREIVVDSLRVEDIPNDGGDGLMISWKPLAKDKRIQEYRIYRGVHPDTLFFLSSVQVNVKTGVAASKMYFYDSGYSTMIDLNSPGKLKHEKKNKGSILYRAVPRDVEVAARLSEDFDLYTSMEDQYYYYTSKKVRSADKEDDNVYAGMKFKQQTILSSLKGSTPADTTFYYYTVVPVNERYNYLGIAKPVKGFSTDNSPEKATAFYGVALEDTRKLQFEWEYPINNGDIASYSIYMLPAIADTEWKQLSDAQKDEIEATQGGMIAQGPVGGGALKNYAILDPVSLGLSWEQAVASRYAIRFQDYAPSVSPLSNLCTLKLSTSAKLPPKAKFRVEDKTMDKGDRVSVTWEEPIVSITKTTSLGKKGTTLKINYQINKTDAQKIGNIYFEFFEPGKKQSFAKINEYYQDNIIKINIPPKYSLRTTGAVPSDSFMVKITIAAKTYKLNPQFGRLSYSKAKLIKDYELVQYLKPDPVMMAYMPTKGLLRNGVDTSTIQNVVYRKGYRSSSYTLVKRNTSFENSLDVTVGYLTIVGKPVSGFNFVKDNKLFTYMGGERHSRELYPKEKAQNLTLVSSDIDFVFDPDSKTVLNTSIFRDEGQRKIEQITGNIRKDQNSVIDLMNRLRTALADSSAAMQSEIAGLKSSIEAQEKQIKLYEQKYELTRSLKYKSNRGRMSYVASVREPENRRHNYMVVKTNGKGLFVESDPDTTATGEYNYYTPISNWFDWDKLLTLIAVLIFGAAVVVFVNLAKKGKDLYLRPIAGLEEIENAVGRATEMGRPMLYCMGIGGLSDVATLASMGILGQVAKKAAEYDTKLIVPCYDYIVMPIAQEIVRESHYAVGRPDSFDKNNIFYLTSAQFAYVAGVNGIMIRERMATNFYMGYFAAEALLMTETGNAVGSVQIAGSDAITQIPFFITTCDYTLIGEELYAASAYLTREPMLLGTLKAQDYFKFLILVLVIAGAILASFQATGLMQLFPLK